MSKHDFIDQDLIKPREDINRVRMGPADDAPRMRGDAPLPEGVSRSVSELDLPLLARHKQTLDSQSAHNAEELERLRRMQEDLEREKRDLEESRRQHADYEKGKAEVISHLNQSLIYLERNEVKTAQIAELLGATRKRFRDLLNELQAIQENTWPDDRVKEELGKALAAIDDGRMEYNKSMARIEAVLGHETATGDRPPVIFEEPAHAEPPAFSHWLKIGVAVSLPVILTLALIAAVLAIIFRSHLAY